MPKISALPVASTLTGAELVPIVQGGTTKYTTALLLGAGEQVATYTALRAYTGTSTAVIVTNTLYGGVFVYDSSDVTSADNGGTIIVNGTKRWKRSFDGDHQVTWFGATGDGTTDDTAAIQAAIDYLESEGGGVLFFPPGSYKTTAMLTISQPVHIIGAGLGNTSSSATATSHLTELIWDGSASGGNYMIEVKSTTAGDYVHHWGIDNIFLNGNNKAFGGLLTSSCRQHAVGRLIVEKCRVVGWRLDDANGVVGGAHGTCEYFSYNSRANAAAQASTGIKITQVAATGVTSSYFEHVIAITVDGNGIDIGNADNHVFNKVVTVTTGTGSGVLFRGLTDGQTGESRKNTIWQYSGSSITAQAKSRNWVGLINSEGTSVACDANASLDYRVIDRNDGRRYTTPNLAVYQSKNLPISEGYLTLGTPALTTYGAGLIRAIAYDSASGETWQWIVPPPPDWSTGRITGVTVWGIKGNSATAGNIVMQLGLLSKSTASGAGGGFTTENLVHAVDGAGTLTFETFNITLGTPYAYPQDNHLMVNLTRLGANASDTYPDDYGVVSVFIKFQANVAAEGVTDYRYGFPTDQIV